MSFPATIDRFRVVRLLGTGGMGNVYEAIDPNIGRRVAIKVLRSDILKDNPELLQRLFIEARAANAIDHAGVVQIFDAKVLPEGTGFLVMELLAGQTLTQRMQQAGGRLQIDAALSISIQIASTLRAGHQRGIVHRDLKPDNIMLVADDAVPGGERVKILDFGIAKLVSEATVAAPLTMADMGLGTPGYMAPEQMRSAALASDRSDIYGLGSVIFEMASGRRPHSATNTADLVVQVLSTDAPAISDFVPELPASLVELIRQMLERERPEARPDITDVLRRLYLVNAELSGMRRQNVPAVPSRAKASSDSGPSVDSADLIESAECAHQTDPSCPETIVLAPIAGSALDQAPSASSISQMQGEKASAPARISRRFVLGLAGGFAAVGLIVGMSWTKRNGPELSPRLLSSQTVTAPLPLSRPANIQPHSYETTPNEKGSGGETAAGENLIQQRTSTRTTETLSTAGLDQRAAMQVPSTIDHASHSKKMNHQSAAAERPTSSPGLPSISKPQLCKGVPKVTSQTDSAVTKAVQDSIRAYKLRLCKGEQLVIRMNSGDGSLSIIATPTRLKGTSSFDANGFLLRIQGELTASGRRAYRPGNITVSL